MKLRERTNNVVSGGNVGEETAFKITMNDKMFRTLSDSLYEDKIGSIVREISCNGVDAHVMAGTPKKPITIHIPNAIEPWFSVKDEGVGMSDEDIRTVYTSYGNSTKDQSNDAIGAFGLGSKTPFAYTDQFTVISIHGGMKRTYIAVINNRGLPTLSMQHEEATDDHPGLEVTIAVESKDFHEFSLKIIQQLKFLPVQPTLINNMRNIKFPTLDDPETILFQDDKFVLGSDKFPINGIHVKQGGVAYPLNTYHFENNDYSDNAFEQFVNSLERNGCILDFAIGDIDVTASREGISYDSRTLDNIRDRLKYVRDTIVKESINEIKTMDYVYDRMAYLNELPYVLSTAVLANDNLDSLLGDYKTAYINGIGFDICGITGHYDVKHLENSEYGKIARNVRTASSRVVNTARFMPKKDIVIFFNDGVPNFVKRVKHYFETEAKLSDYKYAFIINTECKNDSITDKIVKEAKADVVKHFRVNPDVIVNISSLPEIPKAARQGRKGSLPTGYKWNEHNAIFNSSGWPDIFDDLDDLEDTIYVGMHRHDIDWSPDVDMVMRAVNGGLLEMNVIAVNQRTLKRIKDGKIGDNLYSVEDVVADLKAKFESVKADIRALHKYYGYLSTLHHNYGVKRFVWHKIITEEDYPEYFRAMRIIEKRRDILQQRIGKYDSVGSVANVGALRIEGEQAAGKINESFYEKYPMFKMHKHTMVCEADVETMKDYVKMVNSVKGA